jgi:stage II sporulation protein AA (anti-sigma F factor antagonist)
MKSTNLRWPLRISQERRDGVLLLLLAGRVGVASAATLATAVADAVTRGDRHLVLDLSAVDYVSSAGLKALETAADRCAETHGSLALRAASRPVRLALELGGLLERFPIQIT